MHTSQVIVHKQKVFFFFFSHFYQVDGMVVIKRDEPNLAVGQTTK
jgi:hypothetical protein